VGQRIVGNAGTSFPEGTYISSIGVGTITLSQAATSANPTVIAAPMGATTGQAFTYSVTDPVAVELAFPTYGPSISHWGTSVIMDGRFDDDKSLVFTYGQTGVTTITAGAANARALLAIRVAPSVDNGVSAAFGQRELINRMQLVLKNLGISIRGSTTSNILVRAVLNATPSTATTWTNAVGNVSGTQNSSLAQIADYAAAGTTITGGEITAGLFSSGTSTLDLSGVRDLGNCILGGGGATANTGIYPDGPDTLTIVVTNLAATGDVAVTGRISWTEAQA
jgi:hypothetical protein